MSLKKHQITERNSSLNEFQRYNELTERSCDAIVLSYSPEFVLARDSGEAFYIPSKSLVGESFGHALREILGKTENVPDLSDSVCWTTIANLDRLEKRILQGVGEVLVGDPRYETLFQSYLSGSWGIFDHIWRYGQGDFYRFRGEKREQALEKFQRFWTPTEKTRWTEIQRLMNEYSQREAETR